MIRIPENRTLRGRVVQGEAKQVFNHVQMPFFRSDLSNSIRKTMRGRRAHRYPGEISNFLEQEEKFANFNREIIKIKLDHLQNNPRLFIIVLKDNLTSI